MKEIQEQKCASIGMKMSLFCATLAIMVPLFFVIPYVKDMSRYRASENLITVGAVALILAVFYACAALFGKVAGKVICRRRHESGKAISVGIILALGCLVAAALTVDSSILLAKMMSAERVIFGLSSLWITLIGALPAILFGILYGILVRWRLTKVEC
jgi:hypothetical protein